MPCQSRMMSGADTVIGQVMSGVHAVLEQNNVRC